MNIDSYSFGKITIDGSTYTSDLIVLPDRIKDSWWRQQGHYLQWDDLKSVIEKNPDTLIIGTGSYGRMEVNNELIRKLEKKDIRVLVRKTDQAVSLYNQKDSSNTAAALHLSC